MQQISDLLWAFVEYQMMNFIQILACDHRHDVQWDLPYIRFGGPESDCAIKTGANKIFDIEVNADETPKLFWLWQNLDQLGNPDVVGYCQYRRFFTTLAVQQPVIDIPREKLRREFALTPIQQLMLINQHNVDGILHPHFKVIDDHKTPYTYIWEQIYILEGQKNLQLRFQKKAFDLLLDHAPNDLKDAMLKAFEVKENYLCNIFTVKREVFKQFGEAAFRAVEDLLKIMTKEERDELHPYWLAYLFERYTSCWYHALEISGKCKFLKIPLLTIDAGKHIKWEPK